MTFLFRQLGGRNACVEERLSPPCCSFTYSVRNGKGWATEFDWPKELRESTLPAFTIVCESPMESLGPQVEGKEIFVPR